MSGKLNVFQAIANRGVLGIEEGSRSFGLDIPKQHEDGAGIRFFVVVVDDTVSSEVDQVDSEYVCNVADHLIPTFLRHLADRLEDRGAEYEEARKRGVERFVTQVSSPSGV